MNRRNFFARMFGTTFALGASQLVHVQEATAEETAALSQPVPLLFPPLGNDVWIESLTPQMDYPRLDVTNMTNRKFIAGIIDCRLSVDFRGPGCFDLARIIAEHMGKTFGVGPKP